MRFCKHCEDIFKNETKFSKVCDKCKEKGYQRRLELLCLGRQTLKSNRENRFS